MNFDTFCRPTLNFVHVQATGLHAATQGAAGGAMGLEAALSQLNFQEQVEGVEGAGADSETPAELPEWACA